MLSQIENPTSPVILPFEMWLGVMGVAQIDRRLKTLEGKPKL